MLIRIDFLIKSFDRKKRVRITPCALQFCREGTSHKKL